MQNIIGNTGTEKTHGARIRETFSRYYESTSVIRTAEVHGVVLLVESCAEYEAKTGITIPEDESGVSLLDQPHSGDASFTIRDKIEEEISQDMFLRPASECVLEYILEHLPEGAENTPSADLARIVTSSSKQMASEAAESVFKRVIAHIESMMYEELKGEYELMGIFTQWMPPYRVDNRKDLDDGRSAAFMAEHYPALTQLFSKYCNREDVVKKATQYGVQLLTASCQMAEKYGPSIGNDVSGTTLMGLPYNGFRPLTNEKIAFEILTHQKSIYREAWQCVASYFSNQRTPGDIECSPGSLNKIAMGIAASLARQGTQDLFKRIKEHVESKTYAELKQDVLDDAWDAVLRLPHYR